MGADTQMIFNALITVGLTLGGWILNGIRDSVATAVKDQKRTAERVAHIETLVIGEYVKREELQASIGKLEAAIDRNNLAIERGMERIYNRLDSKADKA